MQQFTIKEVERISGIKAHTLRIWEQRYGLIIPNRKESNHRLYSNEDLKAILRIVFLYNHGHKISKIAGMDHNALMELIRHNGHLQDPTNQVLLQLNEAALDTDTERFEQLLEAAIHNMGFEKTMLQVAFPLLQHMGLLWMVNNMMPAQEHFATHIILQKTIAAIDALPAPSQSATTTLLFQPEEEYHELPLLFVQYLMKKKGHACIYAGSNTSYEWVKFYCSQHPVTHLHYHQLTNLGQCEPEEILQQFCNEFPDKTIVLSGSPALCIKKVPANAILLKSQDELFNYVKKLP